VRHCLSVRQPVPFGKYLLLDRISVGGMAEVFKAKSYGVEGFEKIIAIKRILPSMGEDREFIKMFIDEAKIAGQLAHANICQIFELGRIEGAHFIAMEYIWGKDLLQIQNRLRKLRRPMPVDMACFMLAKVCEGLDYAHRKRDAMGRPLEIVHRDCSPQNVLVSYEGEVKVIDFGIAKAAMRNSRTMAGVLKGKFGYMSPEQVRGLPLDRRSDIFALGTMLYECLTSDRLFQGETDFSTLEKVRNVDIQAPRAINPEIPEEVERIILKALAKDTEDRYQWCGDMLADLQQHLMRQEVVFTAKTLAAWLKEVFTSDVERERASLEAYKRIGRDGLIAGVPSAAAKLDVVEHLGEAGQSEDPTMLGAPGFEDLERSQGFETVEVGPVSGSPAAMGSGKPPKNEFGEEAPTEIFGEISEADVDDGPIRKPMPSRPTVPNQGAAAAARPPGFGGGSTAPMGSQTPRPQSLMPQFGANRVGTDGAEPTSRPGSSSGPLPGVAPMVAAADPARSSGSGGGIPRAPGLSGNSGPAPMTSSPNAMTIGPGQMMAPPNLAAASGLKGPGSGPSGPGSGPSGPGSGPNGPGSGLKGPGSGPSGPGSGPNGNGAAPAGPAAMVGTGPSGPGAPMPGMPPNLSGPNAAPHMGPSGPGPHLPGVSPGPGGPGFGPGGPNAPGLGTGLNHPMGPNGPHPGGPNGGPNLPGMPHRQMGPGGPGFGPGGPNGPGGPGMPNGPGGYPPNGPGGPGGYPPNGPGGPGGYPPNGPGGPGWQQQGQPPAHTLIGMQAPPGSTGPMGYPMMPGPGTGMGMGMAVRMVRAVQAWARADCRTGRCRPGSAVPMASRPMAWARTKARVRCRRCRCRPRASVRRRSLRWCAISPSASRSPRSCSPASWSSS
jgi:serine/threonine protein kinase